MISRKKKPTRKSPARQFKTRVLDKAEKSLKGLIDSNMGLFIPFDNLSKKDSAALNTFLDTVKTVPVAMALAAFVKEADEQYS